MRPDDQLAMQATLAFGPGHCPPDLFEGSVAAIIRGLKAHANTISHARHVALEETFPKLRDAIGAGAFHQTAVHHLDDPAVLGRPLDRLGEGFERHLDDAHARDLARIEWAWLDAYNARDAEALTLSMIAALTPEALVEIEAAPHPAARLVVHEAHKGATLVTRPEADVVLAPLDPAAAALFASLEQPRPLGALLADADPTAVLALISAGALTAQGDSP